MGMNTRKTVNEEESCAMLISAIKSQAIKDYMDSIKHSLVPQPGNNKEAMGDAVFFLSMKNEDGSYVFPWERIKYNAWHGVRMFIIQHFSHLPDTWRQDRPTELSFKCPICGADVTPYFSDNKAKKTFFRHKCENCGFKIYTMYSSKDSEHLKYVKECEAPVFLRENIYEVERLEFMKIHDNEIMDAKEKAEAINERIEWWGRFKENLGL